MVTSSFNGSIKIPPNFKILIIDDDIDILKALEYTLTKEKIDVVTVKSGYDAIEILKEDHFDLILLDIKMQGMNGVETFEKIKKMKVKAQSFVIIITAYAEDKDVEAARNLNPIGVIKKPFDLNDLMPYIKKRIKEEINGN